MKTTADFFANVTISLAIRLVREFLRFFRLNQFFVPVVIVRGKCKQFDNSRKKIGNFEFFRANKEVEG